VSPEPPKSDIPGIVGSAILVAIAVAAFYFAKDFTALGSVFPRTVAVLVILFGGAYIVLALVRPGPPKPVEHGSALRRAALFAVMLAWSLLLQSVGFLTTSIVAFTAILLIANYDRWTPRRALGYAFAGALLLGGLYAVFRFGLQVPLPPGLLL
jgi:hypothetical protein